MTVFAFA